ncbi:MAG: UDP-glucose/GDP-mannose dehydrogenase family protein [Deltaproteobacteria bacterium]|nr:UDP-glucose/GDP-mannose dehydrogenase family protein [Deltaproteobacteria bacterium]
MKVAVVGTGYVGLVTGAGLAEDGIDVCCVDVDEARVRALRDGVIPFYEPGLEDLVRRNAQSGRLSFTTALADAVAGRDVAMLCVGTPQGPDGCADLSALFKAADQIAAAVTGPLVLATKSTVPVGTGAALRRRVGGAAHPIHIASNPEFLKEGDAVNDFLRPERIIIGADDDVARLALERLYRPLLLREPRLLFMSTASAELTKYAANGMLAVRISFMNELAALCEKVGAHVDDVRRGIGADSRIGKAFLYPGVGYGGSCFPKDVKALVHTARSHGVGLSILEATDAANTRQRGVMLEKLVAHFGGALHDKTIAVWGLAFKPRTDDIREAPALVLIEGLLALGARVRAWDRAAVKNTRGHFARKDGGNKHGDRLVFCDEEYGCVDDADALVLMTEWPEFKMPDWADIERRLRGRVVFDGRNLWEPSQLRARGFTYHGIGRA